MGCTETGRPHLKSVFSYGSWVLSSGVHTFIPKPMKESSSCILTLNNGKGSPQLTISCLATDITMDSPKSIYNLVSKLWQLTHPDISSHFGSLATGSPLQLFASFHGHVTMTFNSFWQFLAFTSCFQQKMPTGIMDSLNVCNVQTLNDCGVCLMVSAKNVIRLGLVTWWLT